MDVVYISGAGGVGKSTSLKHLSLALANGESIQLKQFDFVFHIALKFAKQNQSLEDIILEQHAALVRHKASLCHIKQLIEGKTNNTILLLLDGYDEYKKGRSPDVDNSLTGGLLNTCILLTSRDTNEVAGLRKFMDAEAEITGFDGKRVEEYITKYIGSEAKTQELIELANKNNLVQTEFVDVDYGIMKIPIFLQMICVLFQRRDSLPKTRTGIIAAIVKRCPDWEEIRKSGKKTDVEWKAALDTSLIKMGKLAWQRLIVGDKSLMFTKVCCHLVICKLVSSV